MDISKCAGINCPLKEKCFRYLADSDEYRQAYLQVAPYDEKTKSCEMFWEVKSKSELRRFNLMNT